MVTATDDSRAACIGGEAKLPNARNTRAFIICGTVIDGSRKRRVQPNRMTEYINTIDPTRDNAKGMTKAGSIRPLFAQCHIRISVAR